MMRSPLVVLFLFATALHGSSNDERKAKIQKAMKPVLSRLAGEWEALDMYQASKVLPEGGRFKTVCKITPGLDGMILRFEYVTNTPAKYKGLGIFTYNPDSEKYTLGWYNNMGERLEFAGDFPGAARLRIAVPNRDTGVRYQLTWDFVDKDHFRLVLADLNAAGGKGDWIFRAVYTRKGARPNAPYLCRPCKLYKELLDGGKKMPPCPECGSPMKKTRFSW